MKAISLTLLTLLAGASSGQIWSAKKVPPAQRKKADETLAQVIKKKQHAQQKAAAEVKTVFRQLNQDFYTDSLLAGDHFRPYWGYAQKNTELHMHQAIESCKKQFFSLAYQMHLTLPKPEIPGEVITLHNDAIEGTDVYGHNGYNDNYVPYCLALFDEILADMQTMAKLTNPILGGYARSSVNALQDVKSKLPQDWKYEGAKYGG